MVATVKAAKKLANLVLALEDLVVGDDLTVDVDFLRFFIFNFSKEEQAVLCVRKVRGLRQSRRRLSQRHPNYQHRDPRRNSRPSTRNN